MPPDITAALLPDTETALFISDSPPLTRAAIHHSIETDTTTRFGLTADCIETLQRDRLAASRLQQLLDDDSATVTELDTDRTETVCITDQTVRIATPSIADYTETPVVVETQSDTAAAYRQLVDTGEPITERFAETGWHDILKAATETFDEAFAETLTAATQTANSTGSLVEILCLVAATHEYTQKGLARFVETYGIASQGTVTNTANELEAAGIIDREPVSVDRRGRPPKRFLLVDETLEPAEYAATLSR